MPLALLALDNEIMLLGFWDIICKDIKKKKKKNITAFPWKEKKKKGKIRVWKKKNGP